MRKILLDSNAYVAFVRGDPASVEIIRLADRIGVSTIVLGELLSGFAIGDREARNREILSRFLGSPRVSTLPVSEQTADHYAQIHLALRRKGRPIPTNDLWIAATALEHGHGIFTFDKHFDEVENLLICRRPEDLLP